MADMSKVNIDKLSYRRINDIINAVNAGAGAEEIVPTLDANEKAYYDYLIEDKKEQEKLYGAPCVFENVEYDYDDPKLDIYND